MMGAAKRILVVDDSEINRDLLEASIERLGHTAVLASSGQEALELIANDIELVLVDLMMPGMHGHELTTRIRNSAEASDIPIIVVTASDSLEDRLTSVELGANDFIAKPIDQTELRVRLFAQLQVKANQDEVKRRERALEDTVDARTNQLVEALRQVAAAEQHIYDAHVDTIRRLAAAAEFRDTEAADHVERVSKYCVLIGGKIGLAREDLAILKYASLMHDVGKIGVADDILLKPASLTSEERRVMQFHTLFGAQILGGSSSKLLEAGQVIAQSHHERWDGKGYPDGISGNEIPLLSRICAIADVFDALTSARPYKSAFPIDRAFTMMREERGKHFDPFLLDVFLNSFDQVSEIVPR
jgi:putative two-component system response regulator